MVRLIVYNIEYCEGLKGHKIEYLKVWRYLKSKPKLDDRMIEFLKKKQPDVLALVEIDAGSPRTDHKDEARYMKKNLKMKSHEETPQYSFMDNQKVWSYIPYIRKQSNALISRYQLYDIKHHHLSSGFKNVIIQASIKCPKKVTLLLAHLALGKKSRSRQIKELSSIINSIDGPTILMGDFNLFEGDKELRHLIATTKLNDAVPLDGHEVLHTYPAWHPSQRLDYVLITEDIKVQHYKVLKAEFSDHLPVMVDFSVKKR